MSYGISWLFLMIAIISEVIASSCLKASEGFTKFWPSVIVVVGYGLAFYFLSLTLKTIPMGVSYAVWSGVGIILLSLIGYFVYQQKLSLPAMIGIGFIIVGVVMVNLNSKPQS